jgi:hypothetical protein
MFEAVTCVHDGHTYDRAALEGRFAENAARSRAKAHDKAAHDRSPSTSRSTSSGGGSSRDSSSGRGSGRDRGLDWDRDRNGHPYNGQLSNNRNSHHHSSGAPVALAAVASATAAAAAAAPAAAPVLVPNWAVRRLLHEWCLCVGLEPPPATFPDTFAARALPRQAASQSASQSASQLADAAGGDPGAGAAVPSSGDRGEAGPGGSSSDEEDFAPGGLPSPTKGNWAIRSPAEVAGIASPSASAAAAAVSGGKGRKGKGAASSTALGPDGLRVKRRPRGGGATAVLAPAELATFYGFAAPPGSGAAKKSKASDKGKDKAVAGKKKEDPKKGRLSAEGADV